MSPAVHSLRGSAERDGTVPPTIYCHLLCLLYCCFILCKWVLPLRLKTVSKGNQLSVCPSVCCSDFFLKHLSCSSYMWYKVCKAFLNIYLNRITGSFEGVAEPFDIHCITCINRVIVQRSWVSVALMEMCMEISTCSLSCSTEQRKIPSSSSSSSRGNFVFDKQRMKKNSWTH